jgi:hypothetical protein
VHLAISSNSAGLQSARVGVSRKVAGQWWRKEAFVKDRDWRRRLLRICRFAVRGWDRR